jgi:hypothetical protein
MTMITTQLLLAPAVQPGLREVQQFKAIAFGRQDERVIRVRLEGIARSWNQQFSRINGCLPLGESSCTFLHLPAVALPVAAGTPGAIQSTFKELP